MTTTKPPASMLDISAYADKASNYTANANDNNAVHRCVTGLTASLGAAADLGNGWHLTFVAIGGDVTIDPNGGELIEGDTTAVVKTGNWAIVYCTGSDFRIIKPPLAMFGNVVITGNLTVNGTITATG